ncbi:3-phosphoserine/phosphohydroxythreonine transaminase [Bacillus massilinigeriensis]|uniref:3-phosphoserine/phosphohydroxythreonine transaminase n=1 Tax=Bacillus massilionigeriensis TaxID=1805475 RepID=UPI00096B65A3|nr:3-phosphoserine/phosphohydroxythreonine transaminase [Bacillus massilionigeriensis]
MERALNFNAGPAALPKEVLLEAQKNMLNFNGTGMGVMELSHRSKPYEEVHHSAKALLKQLLNISDDYDVLFLQGGASLQFSMIPMNLLTEDKIGCYVLSGSWSEKALKEAQKIGRTEIIASSKEQGFKDIPELNTENIDPNAAYVHITSNNTIFGTQWQSFPEVNVPLVADMSSDILSRPFDVNHFGLIYAGAQKNLGPSGVTVVIIKKDLLSRSSDQLPTMLNYQIQAKNDSLYNTPPTLAIYLLKLVLEWAAAQGGVEKIAKVNEEKAKILYDAIDESEGFYIGYAGKNSRSKMNVTFNLQTDELNKAFLAQAKEAGFVGVNGHRSVGGCRASIYNAVPIENVEKLAKFMKEFKAKY